DVGPSQLEQLKTSLEILAFPIAEAVAAVIGFAELEPLDHGAHGTVEDNDALTKKQLEGVGFHEGGETKENSVPGSRNTLTHHDTSIYSFCQEALADVLVREIVLPPRTLEGDAAERSIFDRVQQPILATGFHLRLHQIPHQII